MKSQEKSAEEQQPVSEAVQRRAKRHIIILYACMAVLIFLPFIFIFYRK